MLDHAREVMHVTRGRSRSDLGTDRVLYLALFHLLQIVGEAARRLSESFRESHPEIPWSEIIALRNRLVHGYDNIDADIVWKIITIDVLANSTAQSKLKRSRGVDR